MYYSFIAIESLLQEKVLDNLSTYYERKITWYDRIKEADNVSPISSYSYLLFLKDYRFGKTLLLDGFKNKDFTYSSNSLIIANSLFNFLNAAEYALVLFLLITLIGTLLIISIISFANYSEDRKVSAILSSIGAKNDDVENIYLNESLLSAFLSLFLSFILSIPLMYLSNYLVSKYASLQNIVVIPFKSFYGIPFLYPLGLLVILLVMVGLSTLLPIKFSKKLSLKEELQSND